jgi:hypothetical protein
MSEFEYCSNLIIRKLVEENRQIKHSKVGAEKKKILIGCGIITINLKFKDRKRKA